MKNTPEDNADFVPCKFSEISMMPTGSGVAIIRYKKDGYLLPLAPYEIPVLRFVYHDMLSHNPHIPTVHHLMIEWAKSNGCVISKTMIDDVAGDIVYAKIQYKTKDGKFFYSACTPSDALIFSKLTKAPFVVARNILEKLDKLP